MKAEAVTTAPSAHWLQRATTVRAVAALLACGCGCATEIGDDPAEPDAADSTTALHARFSEDFDAASGGALAAPWIVSSGGATRASVMETGEHGQALRVRASAVAGDFLIAARELPETTGDVTVQFTVRPARGASLVFLLSGSGYASRQLRLQRAPASGALVAAAASGNVECAALAADRWSTVTLALRAAEARGFDVQVDGAATRCTDLAMPIDLPLVSLGVMDASNEDWGGDVYWDDFEVR